jgi:excisionase family DNA binding protein
MAKNTSFFEKYYTVREAAAYLRCMEQTVRDRIKDGSLPAKKIMSRWKIKESDLFAFAAK